MISENNNTSSRSEYRADVEFIFLEVSKFCLRIREPRSGSASELCCSFAVASCRLFAAVLFWVVFVDRVGMIDWMKSDR